MSDALLPKEKITVLLAEYSTLRAEVIQRSTWQVQMGVATLAIIGVGAGLMITANIAAGITLTVLAIAGFLVGWKFNDSETMKVVGGTKSLEQRINGLAGEELLSWETRHGLPAEGHAQRVGRFVSGSSN